MILNKHETFSNQRPSDNNAHILINILKLHHYLIFILQLKIGNHYNIIWIKSKLKIKINLNMKYF